MVAPATSAPISTRPAGRLVIAPVITDDISALAPLTVTSHSSAPVTVRLSSSVGSELSFQRSNKNLNGSAGGGDDFLLGDGNELFNEVDVVEEVTIPAGASTDLVIRFRPESFFRGGDRRQLTTVRAQAYLAVVGDASGVPLVLDVEARACSSLLSIDMDKLIMDDCAPGRPSVKDFTVRNRSEVALVYVLRVPPAAQPCLDFAQYDTGERIAAGGARHVPAHAQERLRVTFLPQAGAVGDLEYVLGVCNLCNGANLEKLTLRCTVNSRDVEDLIILDIGPFPCLDYGECFASRLTSRLVKLSNPGPEPVDISLDTDSPGEVCFDIYSERFGNKGSVFGSGILESGESYDEDEGEDEGADSPVKRARQARAKVAPRPVEPLTLGVVEHAGTPSPKKGIAAPSGAPAARDVLRIH